MKKKLFVFTLIVLVVGSAIGVYAYKEYNRKAIDISLSVPDFKDSALNLLTEFESNDSLSQKKYVGKLLLVDGAIKEISQDDKGFYTIALGDSTSMTSVRCSMDSLFQNNQATLVKGQPVSIKGVCSGYNADELLGSDLILVRCAINKQ
jgi:hypothetical protein